MSMAIRSEGTAKAEQITSDAEEKRAILLSVAEGEAAVIRGKGDAKAAQYYKMFDADPDFAMFLRDMDALGKIFKERSTIVIDDLIKFLNQIPDIEPQK